MEPIALAAHMIDYHGYTWDTARGYNDWALERVHGRDHPWGDSFYSGPNKRHLHTDDDRIVIGTATKHYGVWRGWDE